MKNTPFSVLHLLLELVQLLNYRWNHFEVNLRLMHAKLDKFGLVFIDNHTSETPPASPEA
jgi:hypothetical protein